MTTIRVFDPPMCCASGVCGTDPNPALARFAGDLQWLRSRGIEVERFTLSQHPERFTTDPAVLRAINEGGTDALPIVMVGDRVIAERTYPSRDALAASVGLTSVAVVPGSTGGGCCCKPGECC